MRFSIRRKASINNPVCRNECFSVQVKWHSININPTVSYTIIFWGQLVMVVWVLDLFICVGVHAYNSARKKVFRLCLLLWSLICIPICLSAYMHVCSIICVSVCLFLCLAICLPLCQSACPIVVQSKHDFDIYDMRLVWSMSRIVSLTANVITRTVKYLKFAVGKICLVPGFESDLCTSKVDFLFNFSSVSQ